jgi:hypothetical protein
LTARHPIKPTCEINDVVQEHVEGHETVDIAEVAARMAESLVDLVLRAPEEQQAQLLAATTSYVGQAFLEKTGAIAGPAPERPKAHFSLCRLLTEVQVY